mgnify:FL=1
MSVKRVSGRWRYRCVVRRNDGTKIRISGSAPPHEDTKQRALEMERAHAERERSNVPGALKEEPDPPPAAPTPTPAVAVPTVAEFMPLYLSTVALTNAHATWQEKVRIAARHLVPRIGGMRLDEIQGAAVGDLRLALAATRSGRVAARVQPLSAKSINNVLNVLRHVLDVARERGLIEAVPKIKLLRVRDPQWRFLTYEEADRLVAKTPEPWRTMILVALRTGLRRGELLALRWENVDLVHGRIRVTHNLVRGRLKEPKSGKPREVPLSQTAAAALAAHRHERGPWVFCDAQGQRLRETTVGDVMRRCSTRAGLPAYGWHVLRHTFASHLVMRGVPIRTVQDLMGHASILITQRYAHLLPGATREAVLRLDGEPPAGAAPLAPAGAPAASAASAAVSVPTDGVPATGKSEPKSAPITAPAPPAGPLVPQTWKIRAPSGVVN